MGFEMPEDLSWARAKPKLTTDELIAYMRSKHVRFDLCDEVEAKRYLTEETFYAQLSPLSHLFDRMPDGSFVDLDFAYLADLVEIDRELRRVALDASLDVEARIKVELMALLTERDDEDGFSVVDDYWLSLSPGARRALKNDLDTHASRNTIEGSPWLAKEYLDGLLERYELDMPLWKLLQLTFFATTIQLYGFCADRWGMPQMRRRVSRLQDVKAIRNSCAHGNNLLDAIGSRDMRTPSQTVTSALEQAGVGRDVWEPRLSNRRMRELTSLFWAMGAWGLMTGVGGAARVASWDAFWERVRLHADYYEECALVGGSLAFLERAQRALSR